LASEASVRRQVPPKAGAPVPFIMDSWPSAGAERGTISRRAEPRQGLPNIAPCSPKAAAEGACSVATSLDIPCPRVGGLLGIRLAREGGPLEAARRRDD
jgi:hypothetical protein